jgi:hypothetical protein
VPRGALCSWLDSKAAACLLDEVTALDKQIVVATSELVLKLDTHARTLNFKGKDMNSPRRVAKRRC